MRSCELGPQQPLPSQGLSHLSNHIDVPESISNLVANLSEYLWRIILTTTARLGLSRVGRLYPKRL